MKLISSDEAFRVLSDYYHHRTDVQHDALREALDRVPEVVVNENEYIVREISYPDATIQKVIGELVRCRDCKHSQAWYRDKLRCFMWSGVGIDVFEDGYCSYGERKEDGVDR